MREWMGLHHVTQPRPTASKAFRYFRRGVGCGLLVGAPLWLGLALALVALLSNLH